MEGCVFLTRKNSRGPWESWGYQRPHSHSRGGIQITPVSLCFPSPHLQTGTSEGLPVLLQKVLRCKRFAARPRHEKPPLYSRFRRSSQPPCGHSRTALSTVLESFPSCSLRLVGVATPMQGTDAFALSPRCLPCGDNWSLWKLVIPLVGAVHLEEVGDSEVGDSEVGPGGL